MKTRILTLLTLTLLNVTAFAQQLTAEFPILISEATSESTVIQSAPEWMEYQNHQGEVQVNHGNVVITHPEPEYKDRNSKFVVLEHLGFAGNYNGTVNTVTLGSAAKVTMESNASVTIHDIMHKDVSVRSLRIFCSENATVHLENIAADEILIFARDNSTVRIGTVTADHMLMVTENNASIETKVAVIHDETVVETDENAIVSVNTFWSKKARIIQNSRAGSFKVHDNINIKGKVVIETPSDPKNQVYFGWDKEADPLTFGGNGEFEGVNYRLYLREHIDSLNMTDSERNRVGPSWDELSR